MHGNRHFAIYAIEAEVGVTRTGNPDCPYHSFLMLVDETDLENPIVMEELHFVANSREGHTFLQAITKRVDRDFSQLNMRGYIGGNEEHMREFWERGLDVAFEITSLQEPFTKAAGEKAINCRAGVKAVIEAMGMDFEPVIDDPGAMIGARSNLIEKLSPEVIEAARA